MTTMKIVTDTRPFCLRKHADEAEDLDKDKRKAVGNITNIKMKYLLFYEYLCVAIWTTQKNTAKLCTQFILMHTALLF